MRWTERCEQLLVALLELGLAKALVEKEERTTSDNIQLKIIDREEIALIQRPPCICSECVNETIRVKTILQIKNCCLSSEVKKCLQARCLSGSSEMIDIQQFENSNPIVLVNGLESHITVFPQVHNGHIHLN